MVSLVRMLGHLWNGGEDKDSHLHEPGSSPRREGVRGPGGFGGGVCRDTTMPDSHAAPARRRLGALGRVGTLLGSMWRRIQKETQGV